MFQFKVKLYVCFEGKCLRSQGLVSYEVDAYKKNRCFQFGHNSMHGLKEPKEPITESW